MEGLLRESLSKLKLEDTSQKLPFTSKVLYCSNKSSVFNKDSSDRIFILDAKACQVHILSPDDRFNKKTFFLTPQPLSYPLSMLLSIDHKYLAILTETSVHVIDISRMEMLRSKQAKVIAKLSTAYDGILGDSVKINRLVRVRWHPYIPNLLVFLTSDGRLQICRLTCSSGGSLKFENELVVNLDASHAKSSFRVNLNEAMGTVYMDFDFGSPFFLNEARFAQDALLRVPVYTLCENGDIQLVSASPMAVNHSLVRVVRILPANEDYYTFDFDTLMCLRSADREDQPDVVCFANRGGRIFHGVCLHIPPSVLLQSNSRPQSLRLHFIYCVLFHLFRS